MNNKQLNGYIKHYLEENKTKSAIMLTAPWGTGKSYYIENILTPFLENNGKKRCIVVSLYGLNCITDINRSLYLEMRFKKMKKTTEVQATGVTLGKTVLKGVTSFFGIDITLSEDALNRLYTSIDFKDKLIIFEDIERTNINIFDFLGYVNNLVEQDGVKVLLVANEKELIKYLPAEAQSEAEKESILLCEKYLHKIDREYTDETKEYLRVKEKSVSDTLNYIGDGKNAIKNIILLFENSILSNFANEKNLNEVNNVFEDIEEGNLRAFLFACQKTTDIYNNLTKTYDDEFIESIFFGILVFALKLRRGEQQIWKEDNCISYSLGNKKYPLFKFCYNFIINHIIEQSYIDKAYKEFLEAKLYDMTKSNTDKDVNTILFFDTEKEIDIKRAILSIEKRLLDINDISFYCYGMLANYMICITQFIDCNISKCLKLLIDNLKHRGDKIDEYHLFRSTITIQNEQKKEEFEQQMQLMISALNPKESSLFNFDYAPKNITEFCEKVYNEKGQILNEKSFMQGLNAKKFTDMVYVCTADEICTIRQMFMHLYSSSNIYDFLASDKETLTELVKLLREHEIPENFDKIQVMQRNYLICNLERCIENLD